jgi:glutamate carboxypeptidase
VTTIRRTDGVVRSSAGACLALTIAASLGGTGAANAAADTQLMAAVRACEPDARALLERAVAIDSGTGDAEGLNQLGALLTRELLHSGFTKVDAIPAEPPAVGHNLVATVEGTGRGKILLIAHMDTVFARGTVAQRPYRVVDEQAYGPGAGDDKQGSVAAICAMRALKAIGFSDFARITLIVNSNEETGSFGTRKLFREQAQASDVAINLERGVPPDGAVVSRKGAAVVTLDITGRAAHSGLEPEKGRNAALEAAHQALEIGALADSKRETTVNVTVLQSGDKFNVIPDHAIVKVDVRAYTPEEFDRVERQAKELAGRPSVPEVKVVVTMERTFPPWPHVPSTDALLERARAVYAEIGGKLEAVSVGSSADVALTAETGTPSIDGFGILGDGAHGPDDQADLRSIVPRVYLLARFVMDLGRNPPAKAPTPSAK